MIDSLDIGGAEKLLSSININKDKIFFLNCFFKQAHMADINFVINEKFLLAIYRILKYIRVLNAYNSTHLFYSIFMAELPLG